MSITNASVAARLERLPLSRWHRKVGAVLGIATFFDGFDALTIAFVLPVLVKLWHLSPVQSGTLIGIGYIGQALGALLFAWVAERWGRILALRIAIAIIAVMSLACALSQSYEQLAAARVLQGIGLGGEVPIAAIYINELLRADRRGRLFMLYQATFGIGVMLAAISAAWFVPRLGWTSMFYIGIAPAVVAIIMRRLCPESPRWLVSKGRIDEAERVLAQIEAEVSQQGTIALPPATEIKDPPPQKKASWTELFRGVFLKRTLTVSVLWVVANSCAYGLATWMPTMFTTFYKLPLQQALNYSSLFQIASLLGIVLLMLVIDHIARPRLLIIAYAGAAIPLVILWSLNGGTVSQVVPLAAISSVMIAWTAGVNYLYTPELFPTRIRALGIGFASFCMRVSVIVTPIAIGALLQYRGPLAMFLAIAGVAGVGLVVAWVWGIDTRRRVLEDIA